MLLKKLSFILASVAMLSACQTDDTAETELDEVEETQHTEEEDLDTQEDEAALDEEPDEAIVADEDREPVSDEELENAEAINDLTQYEEFDEQNSFVPDDYDAYLVLEEGGRRIFVFTQNNQQIFKTIYTMPDNQLQIIDLINDELLMNDPI